MLSAFLTVRNVPVPLRRPHEVPLGVRTPVRATRCLFLFGCPLRGVHAFGPPTPSHHHASRSPQREPARCARTSVIVCTSSALPIVPDLSQFDQYGVRNSFTGYRRCWPAHLRQSTRLLPSAHSAMSLAGMRGGVPCREDWLTDNPDLTSDFGAELRCCQGHLDSPRATLRTGTIRD